ncbi:MAG: hypothetical protein ACHQE5_10170 [Actinomycetes bacterium]
MTAMADRQPRKGTIGYKGEDPAYLVAMRRRAPLIRAVGALLLLVGGAAVVVVSLLPSHPRAVSATVTAATAADRTITVSVPGSDVPATVPVDDPAAYPVGTSVVVTVNGTRSDTAVLGDTRDGFVNLWTGVCAFAAGVLLGLPLLRERRQARNST